MHDPMVVAFEIRRPWPQIRSNKHGAHREHRWHIGGAFWVIANREWYWPGLVTVWHVEPDGRDSGEVCKQHARVQRADGRWEWKFHNGWRWHIHHWRIQVHPLQHLRRSLLTRCTWCGGRSRKGSCVNVSHQWDGPRGRWWRGEPGLYHHDCSAAKMAHHVCTCDYPLTESGMSGGKCALCGLFAPFSDRTEEQKARTRELKQVPAGQRPAPTR